MIQNPYNRINCTHNRRLYSKNQSVLTVHSNLQTSKKCESLQQETIVPQVQDNYTKNLKYLIKCNSDYFQNLVKISDFAQPNSYRFKIPAGIGNTTYKRDYLRKYGDLALNTQLPKGKKLVIPFSEKSTYQHEFISHQIPQKEAIECRDSDCNNKLNHLDKSKSCHQCSQGNQCNHELKDGKNNKRNNRLSGCDKIQDDVPRFLETHNKNQYLNWGGNNSVPSLKPETITSTLNMPFQGVSCYSSDFRTHPNISPPQKIIKKSSFPKFSDLTVVKETNYGREFQGKQNDGPEKSMKPKNRGLIRNRLKGNTEYQSEYIYQAGSKFVPVKKTLKELQTLIIDL